MTSSSVTVQNEYISACCNCTYNCLELAEGFLVYGSNHSLAVYDLEESKTVHTFVAHRGRVNCVRFLKAASEPQELVASCCAKGTLIVWERSPSSSIAPSYEAKYVKHHDGVSLTVCDSIQISKGVYLIGCLTTDSRVLIYKVNAEDGEFVLLQDINVKKSMALDLLFHMFPVEENQIQENVVLALGMDNGSVGLYSLDVKDTGMKEFVLSCTLLKHEDWVRCIGFVTLDNGDVLLASGGQDSFIAVWRLTKSKSAKSDFEFQVHHFKDYLVLFDSMIIGHEGWINSLNWNSKGELISCSSDQSTIIWTCSDDIWIEKSRFGIMGGQIPGGYGAKFLNDTVVSYGFQGGIQIWRLEEDNWQVQPSATGHFGPVSDMDYDTAGHYIVTTSHDQTTRIHAPWGLGRWHEISRPQIHGHDLFAVRPMREMVVSGAEEKILRAFQPPDIFFKNLDDISDIVIENKSTAKAASIPALGLSNQSEEASVYENVLELPINVRLDEDFLRSQTLWPEISKLYGHVYEISCIATSPVDALVASGSQSSKPQFSAIILWCATRWKNIGEFPFHKLNVIGLEFSPDGKRLLSVSRDRTWAVWSIKKDIGEIPSFSMEVLQSGSSHTRALWVGTWSPCGKYFVTGARDKKLSVWKEDEGGKYNTHATKVFPNSVSAAAMNEDNMIAVGLETGVIELLQYNEEKEESSRLSSLAALNQSKAHHDVIKRLRFNPKEKFQFASVGFDNIVKVHQINTVS
ncbi:putative elongator complex protein 2 [Orchesella cincta]|uniref:Elongator complex protein 2 n=1 Tax=Orchesella cincta TaxID=48709 RepID=A0A1D2NL98_ORCCI|nr:putative elongator complex protein 2 [Orchesella cincta]